MPITTVTASVCILDHQLNLLLKNSSSAQLPPSAGFLTTALSLQNDSVLAQLNSTLLEYRLPLTAKQCSPWFFQAYQLQNTTCLALLYSVLVPAFQLPPLSQLSWYTLAEISSLKISKPSSLFLPYLTKVLPSILSPST